jgi:rod shape-determining protein MreC
VFADAAGRGPTTAVLDIRRRTGFLFLVVMIGHVVLISAQVNTKSGATVIEAVGFGMISEIQRATSSAFGGVRHVWTNYATLRDAAEENEKLRHQLAAVQVELQKQRAMANSAARLEALLQFRSTVATPTVAAAVIAHDATLGFQTITIDKGAADGLRRDLAVISPEGVVGRVIKHGAHAAMVQLLIDRNAAAGALVERSRAGGVVVGGQGNPPLRLQYLSNLADVRKGDRVVSSGLDGIFPKGYAIGIVESVERGAGLYKEVTVRPTVDFSKLEEVLVVSAPPSPPSGAEAVN